MKIDHIFCTRNDFLESKILNQSSLLLENSLLTIQLFDPKYSNSRIVFGRQKMNEYEYRIPLFGPNYSNSRIIRIIRDNTGVATHFKI